MENFITLALVSAIPAVLVGFTAYIILTKTLKADQVRRDTELLTEAKRITLPMRLQAYERLTLLLERITPDAMVMRLKSQIQTNADLHLAMLQTIRSEYDHNLSQQLYVTADTWSKVKETKEAVATFINDCATATNPAGPSIELSKQIFDSLIENGGLPINHVLNELRKESQRYM